MTLSNAELAAVNCNLVSEVKDYVTCTQTSLDCCLDCAKQAYINYKLANSGCDIPYENYCELAKTPNTDLSCADKISCADSLLLTAKATTTGGVFSFHFENEIDQSSYMSLNITPDTIYQEATGNVIVTDSFGEIQDSYSVSTGDSYNGFVVSSSVTYNPSASIQYVTQPIANNVGGVMTSVRLYKYLNGALSFLDIDISPTNIWTCPSCVPVNPDHLVFDSTNVTTAIKDQIENAIKAIDGDDKIQVEVSKVMTNSGSEAFFFKTKVKHLPSSSWWGFKKDDFRFGYTLATLGVPTMPVVVTTNNNALASPIGSDPGSAYDQSTVLASSLCGSGILTTNVPLVVADLNAATDFYLFAVNTTVTNTGVLNLPVQVAGSIPPCIKSVLQAVATTAVPYTITWKNPSNTVIGTTNTITLTNPVSGNYKATALFSNGECSVVKTVTL